MSNGKGPVKAVTEDKKVQRDLRIGRRVAARRVRSPARQDARSAAWGRLFVIALLGAALAIVLSEDLRKAVLDRLFGAEEEFEYSSTTHAEPRRDAAEPGSTESRLTHRGRGHLYATSSQPHA